MPIEVVDHTPEDTAILARTMDASEYLSTLWTERRDALRMRELTHNAHSRGCDGLLGGCTRCIEERAGRD